MKTPLIIWWIIWFSILAALSVIYLVVSGNEVQAQTDALRFLPALPLVLSSLVRWLVLPRIRYRAQAFPIFILGLAMAEASGLLGIFLVPDLRDTWYTLGMLGVAQFVPRFATRYRD